MPDPGTAEWLREQSERARVFAEADGEALMVPLSDALAALEAREQQVIDRAVELLRAEAQTDVRRRIYEDTWATARDVGISWNEANDSARSALAAAADFLERAALAVLAAAVDHAEKEASDDRPA